MLPATENSGSLSITKPCTEIFSLNSSQTCNNWQISFFNLLINWRSSSKLHFFSCELQYLSLNSWFLSRPLSVSLFITSISHYSLFSVSFCPFHFPLSLHLSLRLLSFLPDFFFNHSRSSFLSYNSTLLTHSLFSSSFLLFSFSFSYCLSSILCSPLCFFFRTTY